MKTIVLLFGGRSGEHEVSLISAASILRNLDRTAYKPILVGISKTGEWFLQEDGPEITRDPPEMGGLEIDTCGRRVYVSPGAGLLVDNPKGGVDELPCDVVFPVLHGTFGEDGSVQGLLECACLPYVGAGILGSAVGMDKHVTKELLLANGLPVVDSILVRSREMDSSQFIHSLARRVEGRFGWPCFVKPACSGSSVGTSKVGDVEALASALEKAFLFDEKVLVEEYIQAREIECAVLGNEEPRAFSPGEIIPSHEFYDYEAKYKDPNGATLRVPAPLSPEQTEAFRDLAVKAYKILSLEGMARVDFFLERRTGKMFLNEVNTIPGFTPISMYPMLCKEGGIPYPELIDALIDLALERFDRRSGITYSYE
ncbi:MAG TPA: D-alanine--D-alanine ligase family protein [Rectinemataceae bacterium]